MKKELKDYARVHFIGIGGVSMSKLAEEAAAVGCIVSGSDIAASHITEGLIKRGIKVYIGHAAKNYRGAELVVKNSAIKEDNPELTAARERSAEIVERAALLGEIMRGYKNSVGIAGMHGKTTATALTAAVLESKNPALHLGGELAGGEINTAGGKRDIMIAEACEYKRNFLCLSPAVAVILNIDRDHLDYYKDIEDIKSAFKDFAARVRFGGALVVNGDDPDCRDITADCEITFGQDPGNDYYASNIVGSGGRYGFDVYKHGEYITRLNLPLYGRHNVYNALAAFIVGRLFDLPASEIKRNIENFRGVRRRFEKLPVKINGASVISDYAHHPKEIAALLATAREAAAGRVICVFEPHTYSRTKALFSEFLTCFFAADLLILAPVYAARENSSAGETSAVLACEIDFIRKDFCVYRETPSEILAFLKETARADDLILIAGAGTLAERLF